jgi:hypothetical protein
MGFLTILLAGLFGAAGFTGYKATRESTETQRLPKLLKLAFCLLLFALPIMAIKAHTHHKIKHILERQEEGKPQHEMWEKPEDDLQMGEWNFPEESEHHRDRHDRHGRKLMGMLKFWGKSSSRHHESKDARADEGQDFDKEDRHHGGRGHGRRHHSQVGKMLHALKVLLKFVCVIAAEAGYLYLFKKFVKVSTEFES